MKAIDEMRDECDALLARLPAELIAALLAMADAEYAAGACPPGKDYVTAYAKRYRKVLKARRKLLKLIVGLLP